MIILRLFIIVFFILWPTDFVVIAPKSRASSSPWSAKAKPQAVLSGRRARGFPKRIVQAVGRSYCCVLKFKHWADVENGDMVQMIPGRRGLLLLRAFHWGVVVNDNIFHFDNFNMMNGTSYLERIESLAEDELFSVGPNPRNEPRLAFEETVSLTYRMVGVVLPYNPIFCNCRHYADYVVYGKTFGKRPNYSDMSDWSIGKFCPLHRNLTRGMDFEHKNFYLLDGHGSPYRLNRIPD